MDSSYLGSQASGPHVGQRPALPAVRSPIDWTHLRLTVLGAPSYSPQRAGGSYFHPMAARPYSSPLAERYRSEPTTCGVPLASTPLSQRIPASGHSRRDRGDTHSSMIDPPPDRAWHGADLPALKGNQGMLDALVRLQQRIAEEAT